MNKESSSPIAWMVKNHIPVNFLMLFFLIGGYFSFKTIKKEVFPEIIINDVVISVSYPGAQPQEIKRSIVETIEAEIQGIDGIKEITSTSQSSSGTVIAELKDFVNTQQTFLDIKNAVDSITTFPVDARKPNVSLTKKRSLAMSLVIYGNQPYNILYEQAQKIKNTLINSDNISLVELDNLPKKEIIIEVFNETLRKYNLTINDISNQIRQHSSELSAGSIKTVAGDILIKTDDLKEFAQQFRKVPILTTDKGSTVFLSDIATLREDYETDIIEYFYNGLPAFKVNVYSIGDESPIVIADSIKDYIKETQNLYGKNITLEILQDRSKAYRDRINLLVRNALTGLVLILLVLGLFLEIRLAFWVMLGVPISILGSFIILKMTGGSLNMVSLFAFIVTLGIVVDDAVIVGEEIYEKRQSGTSFINAAIWGTQEMLMPVTFAVLTNMVAFAPLLFIPGTSGDIFLHIPLVVLSVFFVSLIESLFILPSHLARKSSDNRFWHIINTPQRKFNKRFKEFNQNLFRKIMKFVIKNRYITFALSLAILILSISLVFGNYLKFSFLPQIDRDSVNATIRMLENSTAQERRDATEILTKSSFETSKSFKNSAPIKGVFSSITPDGSIKLTTYLSFSNERQYSGIEYARIWQKNTPVEKVKKAQSIFFIGRVGFGRSNSNDISINISHPTYTIQKEITNAITKEIADYKGITETDNSVDKGKKEFSLKLKPQASLLKMTSSLLARQIRNYIYGSEALRFQRGEDEIRVLVRLPEQQRNSIKTFNEIIIKTPNNSFTALKYLADINEKEAATKIKRSKRKNIFTIDANIDRKEANLNEIVANIKNELLPKYQQKYPAFTYTFEGESEEQNKSLSFMIGAFAIAIAAIYALLCIALHSYIQPFIVMLSIPFGIIGAIGGHFILSYDLSISSIIGIIGLSGVVINDSLVFITTLNRYRQDDMGIHQAAIEACVRRLRPIILTSVTTFLGLLPMLFEPSVQAKFLIPMAISISFGIIFATLIILLFIPCTYVIFSDIGLISKKK